MNNTTKPKYFVYTRKSSESEDRQIQSIEDQTAKLETLAKNYNLTVVDVLSEAKSAKKPFCRPVFSSMIERIKKGEAQGILCWQINRLTRNPVDSGTLAWMLQEGTLLSIQTMDKEYKPEDNVLLFSVESGMANQFIIDLRKNCYRGMEGKALRGWLPSKPPIGYVNDKLEKTIVEDPERFILVRKMWDMMLTGKYTPPQIHKIATQEWGLTAQYSRRRTCLLANSSVYRIFTNIFYTGLFEWDGTEYKGKHKPMITLEEFDRVQRLLDKKGRPRSSKHVHAYTGEIRCAECGCMHTASTKVKEILTTGELKAFHYYYCTRKKKTIECSQKKTLTEKQLEDEIEKHILTSEIHPEFLGWALQYLNERNDTEVEDRAKIYEAQQSSYLQTQKELDNLTKIFMRELIDEEQFIKQRDELRGKLTKAKALLTATEDRASVWQELTEKTFKFVTYARAHLRNQDTKAIDKKAILLGLGWNHTIKDQILSITKHRWLEPIEKGYPALKSRFEGLELEKTIDNAKRMRETELIRSDWCGYRDLNPN